ncbi:MAG: hypothetical protein WAO52_13705 [Prolixibacteraceae bacterium]
MSFKIFIANTFGLIKPTAKIEAAHEALLQDYRQFCDFEQSSLLKEYQDLEMLVNSATFKQKRKELQLLTLKGSKEEAQLKDLKKLERNGKLQKYYSTLKSEDLKRFIELKKLNDSADNKFLAQFEKSSAYKNYLRMKDSAERKKLEELQQITSSAEFKARVAYLEDKQKWEKTEESVQEKRFAELQKMPQLINYLKYKNSNAFDFFKKWDIVFEDRFDSQKLDPEKWITKSHWANQTLGQNFSQPGDLHAFTDGKNIVTDGKSLKIEVRKEKATGMQWRIPFGFVPQDFEYTSGIISTAANEWWNHGILEAKVKYSPSADMVDAIYLLGEETSPQINLLEMGAKNRLGTLTKSNGGIHADCESISGLKTGEFYIFRLEWTSNALIWKINGREMLKIDLHIPSHTLHLNAASILVNEPNGSLPHRFEIDWVRFYQHHKA